MVTPKNNPTPPKNIKLSQHTINLITNLQDSSSSIIIYTPPTAKSMQHRNNNRFFLQLWYILITTS